MRVLVVGGSGYLGQFVVQNLERDERIASVARTYHSSAPVGDDTREASTTAAVRVDLGATDAGACGFSRVEEIWGRPDVVINCAAISQPRACKEDPARARAINVPERLQDWLLALGTPAPLLVHLSTDHVYAGSQGPFYKESDACDPVNEYGRSKVEAERFLLDGRYAQNVVILRSSMIYGPPPPTAPVSRALFLQWMDGVLSRGEDVTFFEDEFRSPVFVDDVVAAIRAAMAAWSEGPGRIWPHPQERVFNVGGPQRMSRLEMARALSRMRGHGEPRGAPRPAAVDGPLDCSMDVTRLGERLGVHPRTFEGALHAIFPSG